MLAVHFIFKFMSRRKKPSKALKRGSFYILDRRWSGLILFQQITSRQLSKNMLNSKWFPIKPEIVSSLLVCYQQNLFGKSYVKVLASNAEEDVQVGFVLLNDFLAVINGSPEWIYN